MYLITIFLPLLNYIFCSFCSRFLGRHFVYVLSIILLTTSFSLSSCILFFLIKFNIVTEITLFKWSVFSGFSFSCTFLFDSVSCIMLFIVTSVSCLVHIYSGMYMDHDPHLPRFLSYLSLFTFFMLFYVTGANFIQLFLGWEGIGLCSYLLINFWYTRVEANKAALKAVVVNKIGDFGFFFGIILCALFFKSVDFSLIEILVFTTAGKMVMTFSIFGFTFTINVVSCICFFFIIGVIGKSAQIGLHTWLPDAMEGPTPVSALIHAATMVTAGVFLMIRSSCFFVESPVLLEFLVILGAITAFFSGTIALFQYDMKKIIAYSTCSQLGYMVLACGLGGFDLALFHLFNHAFFKALLFLSSGVIIHAFNDEQDLRRYGSVLRALPFIFYSMLIGSLSLMGLPYLSGFYSKDKILEFLYYSDTTVSFIGYSLGVFGAFLTAAYSSRLLYLVFFVSLDTKLFFFSTKSYYNLPLRHVRPVSSRFYGPCFSNFFLDLSYLKVFPFNFTLGSLPKILIFFKPPFKVFRFFSIFRVSINSFCLFSFFCNLFNFFFFCAFFVHLFIIVLYSQFKFLGSHLLTIKNIIKIKIKTKRIIKFLGLLFYYEYLILLPLVLLLFGSVFSGYLFFDLFLGAGSSFFSGAIFSKFDLVSVELTSQYPKVLTILPIYLKLLPFFLSILGFILVPIFYSIINKFFLSKSFIFPLVIAWLTFFNKKWFIDNIYNFILNRLFYYIFSLYIAVDKAFLEFLNVGFMQNVSRMAFKVIQIYQCNGHLPGLIKNFAISFVLISFLFFFFIVFYGFSF